MNQRSSLSLYNLLLKTKTPFLRSPKPTSSSLLKSHISPFSPNPPLSNPPLFSNNHPTFSSPNPRFFSGGTTPVSESEKNKIVNEINSKFAEAREEIESAVESKETVYFNEEAECARDAVKEVLDLFDGLLRKLEVKEKEALQRSMGLKIEQLKAELQQLDD